ncbi:hypothetical protein PoB_004711800 [Plakobranchus ocellatus]|uniref:Uncharacterized protein n=1 Tax=Plakobranchus ocellatus TaxID=259542 RepID=A0AAV4BNA0_9GAST|nr:hypothetical protein PoB_004711800 [Plakobranchus ocellatus]
MAASSSHFSNFAISAKKKFLALQPEQRESFLCTSVELDCITQHLSQLGVTRRTFPAPSGDNGDIRERRASVSNQTVVDLEQFRVAEGQPQKLTFQWLHCLTGLDTSRLPSFVKSTMGTYSKTAINMVDEGQVISNIQTVEAVLKSSNCTLHSDGTSRDHKKIVGTQLSLDNGDVFFSWF